ncbi:uncharacterized protein DUF2397 [Streptomyces sp. TLI_235]|nr:DUF2398 family protein [Streptomyces sp. TLI_235]PBC76629.1 uncharacterized protein DUF2397 [Streptomyces sp. TLI_235]
MEQHEYATGARGAAGGAADGRLGGAGQLTAHACTGAYPQAELLARRFADADEAAAHRLFTALFGLYPARHLGGRPADSHGPAAAVSWWHGPTVHRAAAAAARSRGLRRARPETPPGRVPAPAAPGRHRRPDRTRGPGQSAAAGERRTAARLLLAHPLVTPGGPHGAGFPLIHRHADWLTRRFGELLGYPLTVGPGHARLHKAPLAGRTQPGFRPEGYAALVLALGAIADGRVPDLERPELPALLTDWQVVTTEPDGGLALDRDLARTLLTAPAPVPAGPADGTAVAVRRLLAENPVVLTDELAAPERAWLLGRLPAEAELFADFLGLEAEIRAEGIALVDPADELSDLASASAGPLAHTALLLAERLVEELRPLPEEAAPPAVLVPDALIDGALGDITDDYGLPEKPECDYLADRTALRRDVLDLLHRMQLIAEAGRNWVLRAPAARYAPQAELHPAPGTGRHSRGA